jgi:hypothetical protein
MANNKKSRFNRNINNISFIYIIGKVEVMPHKG